MKIKTLVFAGAVSVMCGAAMAGDDSAALQLARKTVASKNYVDGTFATKNYADSTFQTKIPAAASGLSSMFGDGGMVLAASDTDGVVAPRLILPGYNNNQQAEFSVVLRQQQRDWFAGSDTYSQLDEIYAIIDDMYNYATGEPLPYHGKYSIPSLELLVEFLNMLNDKFEPVKNSLAAAPSGLTQMFGGGGMVLAAGDTDGVVAPRLILPGFNNNQQNEFSRAIRQQQRDWLNFTEFGSWNSTWDELEAMIDDIYMQGVTGNEHLPYAARYSIPSMELLVEFLSIVNDKKQDKITAHAANAADSVLTDSATAGTVQKRAIYDGSTTYAAATHSTQIPTMGGVMAGVAAYVDAHSPTIPAPTGDCLNAANHCALVTTYANGTITYNWTVMAK